MNEREIDDLLKNTGLTTSQASVYRLLLRLGPLRAASISKQTRISRTNTYHVMAQLERFGLVERRGQERKTLFAPLHPRKLQNFISAQQQQLDSAKEQLHIGLEKLVVDFSLSEGKAGVYRFEGKDGMIRVYEELIRDRITINTIVDRNLLRKSILHYNPEYIKKRIRSKIWSRVICPDNFTSISDDTRELREVRTLSADAFPFQMDLKVTAKKVVMTTLTESTLSGIIISDLEIVRNYQVLFDFLWSLARKPGG